MKPRIFCPEFEKKPNHDELKYSVEESFCHVSPLCLDIGRVPGPDRHLQLNQIKID